MNNKQLEGLIELAKEYKIPVNDVMDINCTFENKYAKKGFPLEYLEKKAYEQTRAYVRINYGVMRN